MIAIADYYNLLKGIWSLERTITDHRRNQTLTAHGQANFQPTDTALTLSYREEGRFDADQEFFREYLYRFTEDCITIIFADGPAKGQIFQTIYPATGKVNDRHLCGPDCYEGHYDFRAADRFIIMQHVTGPRKDYGMETIYQKAVIPDAA